MLAHLRPALILLALFTLLTGLVYPLAVTGLAQALFPHQADGSLIEKDGSAIGSALIGQSFQSEKYFHGRPSATAPRAYDAAASGGSNLGPTSKALIERVRTDAVKLRQENPAQPIPIDLVTSSASGLDPHISPAAALFQVPRVARARGLDQARLRALVQSQLEGRWLGVFGEPVVNVLELNLALDALR